MPTLSSPRLAAVSLALLTVGVEMLVAVIRQSQCFPQSSSPATRERTGAKGPSIFRSERRGAGQGRGQTLGRDELIPFADHVVVLVHHGVPAGDVAHAVVIRAAVACRAGFLEKRAVWPFYVLRRRLAFHPIGPLVGLHIGLGRREDRRIIALAVEVCARPAGQVPVD